MTNLKPGLSATLEQTVTEAMLANVVGSGSVPVFATPELTVLLEKTAVAAIADYIPAGQTSVGTALNIAHLAATPVGMTVRATATLTAVEGRMLVFEVSAEDAVEPIASGSHTRYLVDAEKFTAKALAKG